MNFRFAYIFYTFSLLPQLKIGRFVHLGRLFLPSHPVGYSLMTMFSQSLPPVARVGGEYLPRLCGDYCTINIKGSNLQKGVVESNDEVYKFLFTVRQ